VQRAEVQERFEHPELALGQAGFGEGRFNRELRPFAARTSFTKVRRASLSSVFLHIRPPKYRLRLVE
jgi:hypothetical protein